MRDWKMKLAAVLVAAALEQGCWLRKEPRKATIVIPPVPQPAPPQPIANPPQLPPSAPTPNLKTSQQMPQLPAPVQPPKPKPKSKPKTTPVTAAAPVPPVAIPTPTEAPQVDSPQPATPPAATPQSPALQPILNTQEANERTKRIQQYLAKARGSISKAERNNADGSQRELIEQVRTFVQQAEELRKVDLVRAENLAERAEVLARGLRQ